jgi:hypothetical protein
LLVIALGDREDVQLRSRNTLIGFIPRWEPSTRIVGHCTWRFPLFLLTSLTLFHSKVDIVIDQFWKPLLAWTNTGDSIPYTNFDDWLHFSNAQ